MSNWMIAAVGVVYGYIAIEQIWKGQWALAFVWGGYCVAQWGLLWVTDKI